MSKWRAFWRGFVSAFDITGLLADDEMRRLRRRILERSDEEDWRAVGRDLERVMKGRR